MRNKLSLALLLLASLAAAGLSCRSGKDAKPGPARKSPVKAAAPYAGQGVQQPIPLGITADHPVISANGTDRASVSLSGGKGGEQAEWILRPQPLCATIIEQTARSLIIQSTLEECIVAVTAKVRFREFTVQISILKNTDDSDGDGFPDAMELSSESDRRNFRAWFSTIAVSQVKHQSDAWPEEKRDCAGLIRFAFSEALKKHDTQTLSKFKYLARTGMPDVRKYNYPDVPVAGDALFRTKPGAFKPEDLDTGVFAPYVTARLLQEANTHFVSRSFEDALPGDLVFYLQLAGSDMPYHSMIYLGAGPDTEPALVYHTGPVNKTRGSMKLMTVADLLKHPDPAWRPAPENENFLGVYRFNILD